MQPQNSAQDGETNAVGLILIGIGTLLFILGVAVSPSSGTQAGLLVVFGGSFQIAGFLIRSIRPRPQPDTPKVWYSIYNPNDIGASSRRNLRPRRRGRDRQTE